MSLDLKKITVSEPPKFAVVMRLSDMAAILGGDYTLILKKEIPADAELCGIEFDTAYDHAVKLLFLSKSTPYEGYRPAICGSAIPRRTT